MRGYYHIYNFQFLERLRLNFDHLNITSPIRFSAFDLMWSPILRITVVSFLLVLSCGREASAQTNATTIPSDLQWFGYSFLTGDTTVWTNIEDDDFYFLARSINQRDTVGLQSIKKDDIYFFGLALIKLDRGPLDRVHSDDLYFVGSAMLERTLAYLQNVKSDQFYFLGRALILRDLEELDKITQKPD